MSKILRFTLLAVWVLSLMTSQTKAQKNSPQHDSKRLIVKLAHDAQLPHSLLNRFGSYQTEAMFDKHPNPQTQSKAEAYGLERIHLVIFDEAVNFDALQAQLSKRPEVIYAEPEYFHSLMYIPNDPLLTNQWYLDSMKVKQAWDITKGSADVIIAIIDSGVKNDHEDLQSNMYYNNAERYGLPGVDDDNNGIVDDSLGYDFFLNNPVSLDVMNHGSKVAGCAAAATDNGLGIAGIAYLSKIMPLKVFNASGQSRSVYRAVKYAAENGAKVINLSLGRVGFPSLFEQEMMRFVTEAYDAVVVAAGGNFVGYYEWYPCSYEHVLGVAMSKQGDIWYHTGAAPTLYGTSYSRKIDVCAPGAASLQLISGAGYTASSGNWGSSFSSPFVAGIAALVRAAYPSLSAEQVRQVIRQTTDPIYHIPENEIAFELMGTGRVNAFKALASPFAKPSVRITAHSFQSDFGQFFRPADTVTLHVEIKNLLAPTSTDFVLKLENPSSFLTLLDSVFVVGTLETMQSTHNHTVPFRFVVHADAPTDLFVPFRVAMQSVAYNDYQYLDFSMDKGRINWTFNYLTTSFDGLGRIGYLDDSPASTTEGLGLYFKNNGNPFLNHAGLMLASPDGRVSDAVFVSPTEKSNKFAPQMRPILNQYNDTISSILASYIDFAPNNPSPIGLSVQQEVLGWRFYVNQLNYVLLDYQITNENTSKLDSLYASFFGLWRIDTDKNLSYFDTEKQASLIYSDSGYAFVKVLNPLKKHEAFAIDGTDSWLNPSDSYADAEKLSSMQTNIRTSTAGESASSPIGQLSGTTFYNVLPAQTVSLKVIVALGQTLSEASTALTNAENNLLPRLTSPKPLISQTSFCPGAARILYPVSDQTYYFYADEHLMDLLAFGRSFEVPADIDQVYVTSKENGLESEALHVFVQTDIANAHFEADVATLNLYVNNKATFSADDSAEGLHYWDFGFGFSEGKADSTVTFFFPGTYPIGHVFVSENGCQDTVYQHFEVVYDYTLGITDQAFEKQFILSPNPSTDGQITVRMPANCQINQVLIFDALGKKIPSKHTYTTDKQLITITTQSSKGVYLLLLHTNQGAVALPFVVSE